ncbi:MAG: hypothetical protein AAGF87_04050 [Bacteroidota bacterium]
MKYLPMFVILGAALGLGAWFWGNARADFLVMGHYFQFSGRQITWTLVSTYVVNEIIQARLNRLELAPDWAPLLRLMCLFLILMIVVLCFAGRESDPESLRYGRFSRQTGPHNMVLGLSFIYALSILTMMLVRKRKPTSLEEEDD